MVMKASISRSATWLFTTRYGKALRRTGRFSPPGRSRARPENFSFKVIEEIDLDQLTCGREHALKERIAHWRELLGGVAAI